MDQPAKSLLKYKNPELIKTHSDTESASCIILNTILPLRQWMVGDQLWMQEVSTAASTTNDVIHLKEELDKKLQKRQARHTGLCHVRRELYPQCFDEIIRQVTINCSERGLLLLRIKNEFEMTLNTYQALHESSVAFAARTEFRARQDGVDMKNRMSALEKERDDLKLQLNEEQARCAAIEKREKKKAQLVEEMHSEENEVLKKNIQQLNAQLAEKIEPE